MITLKLHKSYLQFECNFKHLIKVCKIYLEAHLYIDHRPAKTIFTNRLSIPNLSTRE